MLEKIKKNITLPAICPECKAKNNLRGDKEEAFCQYCGERFNTKVAKEQYRLQQNKEINDALNKVKKNAVDGALGFLEKQKEKINNSERKPKNVDKKSHVNEYTFEEEKEKDLEEIDNTTKEFVETDASKSDSMKEDEKKNLNFYHGRSVENEKSFKLPKTVTEKIIKYNKLHGVKWIKKYWWTITLIFVLVIGGVITSILLEDDEEEKVAKKVDTPAKGEEKVSQEELAATALEENFPVEYAKRAAVVAITNGYALDVFTADGNSYDTSKFHSYSEASGNLKDYFIEVIDWGKWSAKDDDTWHVVGLRLEFFSSGAEGEASLDVTKVGAEYQVTNISGKKANPGALEGYHMEMSDLNTDLNSNYGSFLTVPESLILEDRDDDEVAATDKSGILEDQTARRAVDSYGNNEYPYGFKAHWIKGLYNAEQTSDGKWIYKVDITVTNAFGEEVKGILDVTVGGTTNSPEVEDFIAY